MTTATKEVFVEAKIRYACAAELGLPNEHLVFTGYDAIGGYVDFTVGGRDFFARLNKTGHTIKKNSVRRA